MPAWLVELGLSWAPLSGPRAQRPWSDLRKGGGSRNAQALRTSVGNDAGVPPAPRRLTEVSGLEKGQASPPQPSCHVLGLWLYRGSWGGVPIRPGRAPYLISLGIKVDTQESQESESSATPGAPFSGHTVATGFGGGWWPIPSCPVCSPWSWLWVPRGREPKRSQYKLVVGETRVYISVLAASAWPDAPGLPGFSVKRRWQNFMVHAEKES